MRSLVCVRGASLCLTIDGKLCIATLNISLLAQHIGDDRAEHGHNQERKAGFAAWPMVMLL